MSLFNLQNRMKARLALKFAVFTTAILAVSFITLGVFFVEKQRKVVLHDLEQLSTALATNLAANSAFGLVTRNRNQLKNLLRSLANVRDIEFSWIEDQAGNLMARFGNIPQALFEEIKLRLRRKKAHQGQMGRESCGATGHGERILFLHPNGFPELLLACAPVVGPEPVSREALILDSHGKKGRRVILGTVYVAMSLKRVDKDILSAKQQSLAIISVVGFISLLLTVFVVHVITSPLYRLKTAAEQVMEGINPPFVTVKSRDEIRDLAEAFNKMVSQLMSGKEALEKAYGELERVNASLEEKVAQRTRVLQNTVEELTEARDELEKAYNEMKAMYDAKAAFLRTASHELRTPLTAIKANIDYMRTYLWNELGEEAREIVEAVHKNCNNMRSMVEHMLAMLRIDSDSMPLTLESVNLGELVREAVSQLKGLQKGRQTIIDIPDDLYLECDSVKIHDLCFNILSNAYKFTAEDGIVEIRAWQQDDMIFLEFKDNGEGIPEEHLANIFEPFYQAHSGREGSGLGLAIARAIIEKHGGRIEAGSEQGQGTTFTIKIPRFFQAS